MNKGDLSILIVDDHDVVVRGIAMIVEETFAEAPVSIDTVTRGCEAIEIISRRHYDLCILDIEMPDIDGLGMLKIIRAEYPEIKIIVNTIHEELWYVKDYIKAGVEGILFKSVKAEEIGKAVKTVTDGGRYFCSRARAIAKIVEGYNSPTTKELEVLQLLSAGKSTDEIARRLGISPKTVETHRCHLLDKLQARNVAELIMNAVSQGILSVNK